MEKAPSLPDLVDVAGAVADLTPVDWPALEAEAAGSRQPRRAQAAASPRPHRARLRRRSSRRRLSDRRAREERAARHLGSSHHPRTHRPRHFGDVYRAHDRRLDRIVALKLLKRRAADDEASGAEVIREGQLLAKVRHPNVVTVYGAERIDGRVGMWMEFVDGRTLEEELRASGPSTAGPSDRRRARAVQRAGGRARRRAAPSRPEGAERDARDRRPAAAYRLRRRPRPHGGDRRRAGAELAGTPLYLAPEVLNGAPASVASELYEPRGAAVSPGDRVLSGARPHAARTADAHARGDRVGMRAYRDKVPRALASLIDQAANPDPAIRFESVQALKSALQRTRQRRRHLGRWVLILTALAVIAVAGLNVVWSRTPALRIVSQTIIPIKQSLAGLALRFAKDDRLYIQQFDRLFSVIPGQPESERTEFDALGPFSIIDVSSFGQDYIALKAVGTADMGELWIFPSSGRPQRVGNVQCRRAVWAPDQRRIACVDVHARSLS